MPRDSTGLYTLDPSNPVIPATIIETDWANPTCQDIAHALTDSLSRTGSGGMLAPFRYADGTINVPGSSWVNEPTSGWYRAATNDFRFAMNGEDVFTITDEGITLAPGLEAFNISAFINIQDDQPVDFQVGEQWWESDTAGHYMKYRNPDGSITLVALGTVGGDFIATAEKGIPNGVATLDGAGKVPWAQLPPITGAELPAEVLTEAEAAATYTPLTTFNAHVAAPDPHPGYLTAAEGTAAYEPIGAVAAHAAAADPHPGYLTAAEGNAAYEAVGAVAAHAAAPDPHPGYLTPAEGNAAMRPQARSRRMRRHQILTRGI